MQVIPLSKFRTNQTATLLRAIQGESVFLTSRIGDFKLVPVSVEEKIATRIREGLNSQPRAQTHFLMSFEVKTTPHFEREAKILAKRYKSFKADMKDFVESLEKNPMQGDELSPGIRKIRLAIVSKGKGKSGGARVITYTICASESEGRVYLVDVYDKSDFSTVSVSILKKIISEQGIL